MAFQFALTFRVPPHLASFKSLAILLFSNVVWLQTLLNCFVTLTLGHNVRIELLL